MPEEYIFLDEDGAMGTGAVGTSSNIPANNTDSTGEAEIAANPPVRKKKKTDLFKRSAPGVPKTLSQILKREK